MNKLNLNEQAQEILKIAEKHGVESNFFFLTTFKRYQVQIKMLSDLEKTIYDEGMTVQKTYSRGEKNTYVHPAVSAYNKTADCANKTVSTLVRIITALRPQDSSNEPDPLLDYLNGRKPIS
jgi:predicted secreted Zn-dependent protease